MRAWTIALLVVHVLHLPVPFPDLDGECRGASIHSLRESQAWHVLLFGVLPNDDIDRGPFRAHDQQADHGLTGSPYGDLAIKSVDCAASTPASERLAFPLEIVHAVDFVNVTHADRNGVAARTRDLCAPAALISCAELCRWVL